MIIGVGSNNPVKVKAVVVAASETWPEVEVKGIAVKSGIAEQPRSDEETRQGAQNRAKIVFAKTKLNLGLGLEGGVFERNPGELWSTVWVAVWDGRKFYEANGARFRVPDLIAKPILQGGEMGPIVSQIFGGKDIKRTNGAIGVVTKNFVDRTEEYAAIAKLSLGLWYGRDWEKEVKIKEIVDKIKNKPKT